MDSWQSTLDSVVPAIVALSVTAVRGFQDDVPGAHGGTGFVVDKNGLILTNRHVCTCGPHRATAAFVGCPASEEVAVSIAYIDPVHDFALLRFNPRDLKQTTLVQIELDPWGCTVGEDIRVVGNDNLEKLQILAGTIARVDRNPPGQDGEYFDENTFYAMAASGTRGGSSGSPVLNKHGKAVALNAAATNGTMHAFYLPLHRIVHALELVQAGAPVPRGSLCTAFEYITLAEAERLGVEAGFLQSLLDGDSSYGATFSKACRPGGMLQVRSCIPGTKAFETFHSGDVLLEIDGRPCVDFVLLDKALDDAVGTPLSLSVVRNGNVHKVTCQVVDLRALIPSEFMEMGFGVFHEISYQTAQKAHIPMSGIYVATAGAVIGQSLKSDTVICEVNGLATTDLKAFEAAVVQVPDEQYFQVTWMSPRSAQRRQYKTAVKMQRQWGLMRTWSLDGCCWLPSQTLPAPPLHQPDALAKKRKRRSSASSASGVSGSRKRAPCKAGLSSLAGSLCQVTFRTLQQFDLDVAASPENTSEGGEMICCRGAGIFLDADAGLVITDRATVPQPLGDIEVLFGDETRSASALFLHPIHSLVILRVAGADHGEAFGSSASFVDLQLSDGQECDLLGVDSQGRQVASKVHVQEVRSVQLPSYSPPRWHDSNIEGAVIHDAPDDVASGVLSVANRICAFYTCATSIDNGEVHRFSYGLPVYAFLPILKQLAPKKGCPKQPAVASLEVQLKSMALSNLRRLPPQLRPSPEWLGKLERARKSGAGGAGVAVLVEGITAGGPCEPVAEEGDILVSVGGQVVSSAKEVEKRLETLKEAVLKTKPSQRSMKVQLVLLRRREEIRTEVHVPFLGSDGARRILGWNGLVVQEIPRSVRESGPVPGGAGVCISQTLLGSPAEQYGIEGTFILAVDGIPTPTLDALLAVGQSGKHVRIETASMNGRRCLKTLMPDALYWPLFEMLQDEYGTWSYRELRPQK